MEWSLKLNNTPPKKEFNIAFMVHKNCKTIKVIIHDECRLALVFYLSQKTLLKKYIYPTPILLLIVAFYYAILFCLTFLKC